jgi:hypothetical protein
MSIDSPLPEEAAQANLATPAEDLLDCFFELVKLLIAIALLFLLTSICFKAVATRTYTIFVLWYLLLDEAWCSRSAGDDVEDGDFCWGQECVGLSLVDILVLS